MIKFDLIKPGDVLYDCHRQKMGNTTMSRMGSWTVKVISVDKEAKTAQVSWNGNSPQKYRLHQIERLRRSPIKGAD